MRAMIVFLILSVGCGASGEKSPPAAPFKLFPVVVDTLIVKCDSFKVETDPFNTTITVECY